MWTKYGKSLSAQNGVVGVEHQGVPTTNPYGKRLVALAGQGVQFAICNRTTRAYSSRAAREASAANDDVQKEFMANTVIAGQFVRAGVIAVTRAQ